MRALCFIGNREVNLTPLLGRLKTATWMRDWSQACPCISVDRFGHRTGGDGGTSDWSAGAAACGQAWTRAEAAAAVGAD